MFSNFTIALLMGAGASAYFYAKIKNKTGQNTKSSLIVAGASFVIIVIALTILLDMIFKK